MCVHASALSKGSLGSPADFEACTLVQRTAPALARCHENTYAITAARQRMNLERAGHRMCSPALTATAHPTQEPIKLRGKILFEASLATAGHCLRRQEKLHKN